MVDLLFFGARNGRSGQLVTTAAIAMSTASPRHAQFSALGYYSYIAWKSLQAADTATETIAGKSGCGAT